MKEIILDTNVLARYLLADIPLQYKQAIDVFTRIEKGEVRGLISILVIDELIWALGNYYSLKRKDYLSSILKILFLNKIETIEVKKEVIINVLEKMKRKDIDFTDIYLNQIASNRLILSFDKDFEKLKN